MKRSCPCHIHNKSIQVEDFGIPLSCQVQLFPIIHIPAELKSPYQLNVRDEEHTFPGALYTLHLATQELLWYKVLDDGTHVEGEGWDTVGSWKIWRQGCWS